MFVWDDKMVSDGLDDYFLDFFPTAYDTIYKWCASGKLKSIQVSNKRLIPKEWLFEFMLSKEFLFKPMPSDWQIVTVHRALLNYKKEE